MRIFLVAIMIAAFTMPAYSQMGGGSKSGLGKPPDPQKPVVDVEKKKRDDKAFDEAVKRIPAPDKKYDPWGAVRDTGNH